MKRVKFIFAALLVCAMASGACALTKEEIDARWNEINEAAELRRAGESKAAALREQLDAEIIDDTLERLWTRATKAKNDTDALCAAWSLLRTRLPEGDVSRWTEVDEFYLPAFIPRAFMVIDALYIALIQLPKLDGGEWLAADLLKAFSKSSHGRYDFIGVCPKPVAEALGDIVARTKLRGIWTPREVVGKLPIARGVHVETTQSRAISERMTFLDGAGLPASNGFYAWDRRTGEIYRVVSDPVIIIIPDM